MLRLLLAGGVAVLLVGCGDKKTEFPTPASAENHPWFPVSVGSTHELGKMTVTDGALQCEGCHRPTAETLTQVRCDTCHKHPENVARRLHLSVANFTVDTSGITDPDVTAELRGANCYSCHPTGEKVAFDHAQITDTCAMCHEAGSSFAALPLTDGRTHRDVGGADCGSCHVITSWKDVKASPGDSIASPGHDVTLTAYVPLYASQGVAISLLTPSVETLTMNMNHASTDIPAAANACTTCHLVTGSYAPGTFHSTLANLTLAQPTKCDSCHANARPVGFVGPFATSPVRSPTGPEMKHDAVSWPNGTGATALLSADCGVCHQAPGNGGVDWTAGASGTSKVLFHQSLANASLTQPTSCADCHANTLPRAVLSLTSGISFDHGTLDAQADCATCHAASSQAPFTSWSGGRYHLAGATLPTSCASCHEGQRPTSTTGWTKPNYAAAPFDYGTNALGDKHGAGMDCVSCHANPGTGAWGTNQNWAGGHFTHTNTLTSCVTCHSTQRPDLVLGAAQANTALMFDHVLNGSGDCVGCHQATVTANTYARYFNASNMLPGGDWQGGINYPGGFFSASTTQSYVVNETTLVRTGPNNLVTSMTTASVRRFNGMLHTSMQVPAQMAPGGTGMPDNSTCWHCHTATGTTVTAFSNGKFHDALTNFRTTPAAAITALPQPTTGCTDCHATGRPSNIVQRAASTLRSMDHAARFTSAVMLGGKSVTSVDQVECAVCHANLGVAWDDGELHSKIGAAQLQECVSCHYPLMADGTKADQTPAMGNTMKHRSGTLTTQACATCHTDALTRTTTIASTAFQGGALHPNVPAQPTACIDCHSAAQPTLTTQGTVTWMFTSGGGTASNGGMYMSHTSPLVATRDCVTCHAADAKTMGSAWSRDSKFHQPVPTGVTSCGACHGLSNGGGAVPGTGNNLPSGLTNSSTTTSASTGTGVSGVLDQVSHDDLNVTSRDCVACHASSTTSWKGGRFHPATTSASPLISNGTTARCSNCHLNVKPTAAFTAQDHSTFTAMSGSQDCVSCHSFPGTGTPLAANWLGATGAPTFISVGGFTIPRPPASTAGTTQLGIMSLPHPGAMVGACTSCHQSAGGGRNALGYDHGSTLIDANCGACHEAGSDLLSPTWNGATSTTTGAGDTRPFTLTSLVAQFGNGLTVTHPTHFFPADCSQCHLKPAGIAVTTTGAAYAAAWSFPHDQQRMSNPTTCVMCHVNGIPTAPDGGVADPSANVNVTGRVPRWSATTIASVTAQAQSLPMNMLHTSPEVKAPANASCANCHPTASSGFYAPGQFHSALSNLLQPAPATCVSCHGNDAPVGFVGANAVLPPRLPVTGPMRHEAVSWNVNVRGTTTLVSKECAACHAAPSATLAATWATSSDGGTVAYHASLSTQPSSCLDCHANARPVGALTSTTAQLVAGVSYDHGTGTGLNDCASCHQAVAPVTSWRGGKFHLTGSTNPTTCLPCHAGERPTSNTGWQSTTYTRAPFDYGGNELGISHGDGLDCASCHAGPGTGAWGSTQNWQGGVFAHTPSSPAGTTCLACHTTQRPDRVLGITQANTALMFDHSTNGTGECFGCHQATVNAGTYANYFNPTTMMLPNGDWKGGASYPGSVLVSAPTQSITVSELQLVKSGARVTGMNSVSETIHNDMLHVSAQLPVELNAGPTGMPDATKCWHCHTSTGTTVTNFSNGQYHSALTSYRATPAGAVTPFPQPTRCNDCHGSMEPKNIVRLAGSNLMPMDHSATFVTAVNLGGASVTAVNQADCSVCHTATPGSSWAGAQFHSRIGAATPSDCVTCHYPLMVDPGADVTSGTTFVMKHQSTQVTLQACATCHTTALAQAATTTLAGWKTGKLHAVSSPQPTGCIDCHAVSDPVVVTQSTVTYVFPLGGTASNGGQWHNHTSSWVAGKDCAVCHAADARTSGSAWSRSDTFHPQAPTATTCTECHGTGNGKGTVLGTGNNLPTGLTNSDMASASAGVANTGIAAGAKAQISHADVNVTALDCGVCHSQKGTSTTAGIQGREWAQATFHAQYTGTRALVLNGTTGRCSNCHLSEKPGTAYTTFDHSGVTATSTQDCSFCHSFPGTGTASAPNWLGAVGVPTYISVGGFTVPVPPADGGTFIQPGITNLPHPTVGTGVMCTTCHDSPSGGKNAKGYDHASTLITTKCTSCHETGSNLVSVPWNSATTINAGAGNTRPITLLQNTASFSGNTCTNFIAYNHFFPMNCRECHTAPTGVVNPTTGAAYRTKWVFVHKETNMTNPKTCDMCHLAPANCKKG